MSERNDHDSIILKLSFSSRTIIKYMSIYTQKNSRLAIKKTVSEWLLFNANAATFQLYHDESKLIFNEMMMRSTLF